MFTKFEVVRYTSDMGCRLFQVMILEADDCFLLGNRKQYIFAIKIRRADSLYWHQIGFEK